jgi:hypothetical protein
MQDRTFKQIRVSEFIYLLEVECYGDYIEVELAFIEPVLWWGRFRRGEALRILLKGDGDTS